MDVTLRGWPPPSRVCGVSMYMSTFELLRRVSGALRAVVSIRLVAVRLLLGMSPCGLGLVFVQVIMGAVCRGGYVVVARGVRVHALAA